MTIDDNLLFENFDFETDEDDNELTIGLRATQGGMNPRQRPMIALTIADLQILDVQENGDMTIRGLDRASLEIEVRGNGAITLDGQLDRLTLNLSGDVSMSAENLAVEELRLENTGDGDVVVQVADTVTSKVDGEGAGIIIGDPATIDVQQKGNGKLQTR